MLYLDLGSRVKNQQNETDLLARPCSRVHGAPWISAPWSRRHQLWSSRRPLEQPSSDHLQSDPPKQCENLKNKSHLNSSFWLDECNDLTTWVDVSDADSRHLTPFIGPANDAPTSTNCCWNCMSWPHQVCSLTQFYFVDFSKSRISGKKSVFNKRPIKVWVS